MNASPRRTHLSTEPREDPAPDGPCHHVAGARAHLARYAEHYTSRFSRWVLLNAAGTRLARPPRGPSLVYTSRLIATNPLWRTSRTRCATCCATGLVGRVGVTLTTNQLTEDSTRGRTIRTVFFGGRPDRRSVLLGGPRTGVLIQVAETLGFCGGSPSVRIRLGCRLGLDALAQQRILLAVAGSKLKAPVGKAVERADKRAVTDRTYQNPERLKAMHELCVEYTSSVSRRGDASCPDRHTTAEEIRGYRLAVGGEGGSHLETQNGGGGPHVETGKRTGYGLTAVTAAHTYREPPQSRPGGQHGRLSERLERRSCAMVKANTSADCYNTARTNSSGARDKSRRAADLAIRCAWLFTNPFSFNGARLNRPIRRECLDHIIVLSPDGLQRVLAEYVAYYMTARTHLSLGKDSPTSRPVSSSSTGRVIETPQVNGLHHRYERAAA